MHVSVHATLRYFLLHCIYKLLSKYAFRVAIIRLIVIPDYNTIYVYIVSGGTIDDLASFWVDFSDCIDELFEQNNIAETTIIPILYPVLGLDTLDPIIY